MTLQIEVPVKTQTLALRQVQIKYRKTRLKLPQTQIKDPEGAESVFREYWEDIDVYETFYAMMLDRAHNIIGILKVGQGGINATVVDPRLIFSAALNTLASSIIVAHNHPSGNLKPSKHDKTLTDRLVQIGELMQINVKDHIILSPCGAYSSMMSS